MKALCVKAQSELLGEKLGQVWFNVADVTLGYDVTVIL